MTPIPTLIRFWKTLMALTLMLMVTTGVLMFLRFSMLNELSEQAA